MMAMISFMASPFWRPSPRQESLEVGVGLHAVLADVEPEQFLLSADPPPTCKPWAKIEKELC